MRAIGSWSSKREPRAEVQSPAFFLPLRRFAAFEPLEPPSLAAQGNVAFGSNSEVGARNREVRFTPENGNRQRGPHVRKVRQNPTSFLPKTLAFVGLIGILPWVWPQRRDNG